jgi:hypothetical protein
VRQSRPGTRRFLRRLRRRASQVTSSWRSRSGFGRLSLGTAGPSPWLRRGVLAAALLGVAFLPYPQPSAPAVAGTVTCRAFCHGTQQNMLRWTLPLPGQWDVDSEPAGTVPASGQAYAAVGDGVVAVGTGMTVHAYSIRDHKQLWQPDALTGFPADAAIISVRTWPGEITAGVSFTGKGGVPQRTEVVIPDATGVQEDAYPAAVSGGAVAASASAGYTVIVGPTAVISYDNATGRVRWQRTIGSVPLTWQSDGQYLYVTEAAGALRRIDMVTGADVVVVPSAGSETATFAGTLDEAFDGVLLFADASGVTAYSGSTGAQLWSLAGAVPDGADPVQGKIYLTVGSTLVAVAPLTGRQQATAPGLGSEMYAVRDGVALGFDPDDDGTAWGYDLSAQRAVLSATGLGSPHFFIDLSGLGGSAAADGDLVVIAACAQAGPVIQPSPSTQPDPGPSGSGLLSAPPSPSAGTSPSTSLSPSPSPSPTATASAVQPCLRPELVALGL